MRDSSWHVSLRAGLAVVALVTLTACGRPKPPSAPGTREISTTGAHTVFTDTAMFRRICTQADSGLTPAIDRCTPRDQGLRIPRRP